MSKESNRYSDRMEELADSDARMWIAEWGADWRRAGRTCGAEWFTQMEMKTVILSGRMILDIWIIEPVALMLVWIQYIWIAEEWRWILNGYESQPMLECLGSFCLGVTVADLEIKVGLIWDFNGSKGLCCNLGFIILYSSLRVDLSAPPSDGPFTHHLSKNCVILVPTIISQVPHVPS